MVRWGGKGGELAALAVSDEECEARERAMPAVVRGAVALEPRVEIEAARRALARAVAQGALGAGYAVRLDGEVVVFAGGAAGPESGRLELDAAKGQVRYQLTVGASERARFIQAVLVATLASLTATLLWSWMIHLALPFGVGVGAVTAGANLMLDRRRWRHRVEALVSNLPLLVDARGQQAG